jgi:tRNA A-37 threonylcarbamoyl transferase component Bud32
MTTTLEILPSHELLLRAAGLSSFDDFLKVQCGDTSSKHKTRETAPLEIGGRRFFLKRTFKVPAAHAIGPWLRGKSGFSQPMVEWTMLGRLETCGVPAMKRVAAGERRSLGRPVQAFLLIEAVPMQYTLENWLVPGFSKPEALSIRQRRVLLRSLGALIGKLHTAGFRWPDIHAKHIFAQRGEPAWEFCLIDVERMTSDGRTEVVQSELDKPTQRDLRALLRGLRPAPISRIDILAFAGGYLGGGRRQSTGKLPKWARGEQTPRLPDDYEHPRSIPLARVNKMYVDKRATGWLGEMGMQSMKDVFEVKPERSLSKPGLARYRERLELKTPGENGRAGTIFLKRYIRPPLIEQIRRMMATGLFRATAYHETHFIKKLTLLGIPTLRSVAFGQKMNGPLEKRSFSMTRGLKGMSLETLIDEVRAKSRPAPSAGERHEIARQLGLIVGALHRNRLFHRDLYLCHVFLTHNDDGRVVLRVIDLARMIEKPLRTRRWRIKDLAALDFSTGNDVVTRTDRLRFVRGYYGNDLSHETLRGDFEGIGAKRRRIARHDERRQSRMTGEART